MVQTWWRQAKRFVMLGAAIALGLFLVGVVGVVVLVVSAMSSGLPSLEALENPKSELSTQVISADGEVIGEFYVKRRRYLPYDSIPPFFIKALIATEDRAFFDHWGIHVMRILKAAVKNVLAGRIKEGASTITQQLARNLYFTHKVSLERKIKEALTAIQIERRYTKREILELYANSVYFGRGAYGLQVAAQVYFNKAPSQLTLGECAYLVALLKAPNNYDYRVNYEKAIQRRNLVLKNMLAMGYITQQMYEEAIAEPLKPAEGETVARDPYAIAAQFVEMVRRSLSRDTLLYGYDLYRDGLKIYTTLNYRIQRYAWQALQQRLQWLQKQFDRQWRWRRFPELRKAILERAIRNSQQYQTAAPADRQKIRAQLLRDKRFVDSVLHRATRIQGAVVVLDNETGAIRALIGSTLLEPTERYGLNRALQIRRQPGSAFKPFVYLAALYNGLTPDSLIDATTFEYPLPNGETWVLQGREQDTGKVPLHIGLKYSINSVAGRLIAYYTTPEQVIQLARKMGIESPLEPVLSIALGSEEVRPFELTRAFMCFPNEGLYVEPYFITRIEDRFGNVLYNRNGRIDARPAIEPKYARQMVTMLEEVVDGGTAARIRQDFVYPACGKTGTTNDYADAWFVGATPQLTAGIWLGFDDRRITFGDKFGYGGVAAAPIWGKMMRSIYEDKLLGFDPTRDFPRDQTALQLPADTTDLIPQIERTIILPQLTAPEQPVRFPVLKVEESESNQ